MGDDETLDPKSILTSKLFWTGFLTIGANVIGAWSPPVGQFLKDNALVLGGALGALTIGFRSVTSQPVTLSFSKKL